MTDGHVEVRPFTSYVADRRPDVPTSSISFGEVRDTKVKVRRVFACSDLADSVQIVSELIALQLPIDWTTFAWPDTPKLGNIVLVKGDPKWAWQPAAPAFEVHAMDVPAATTVDTFVVDHVVLLVPDLATAVQRFDTIGLQPRLRMDVGGRPAAFFRAGTVIEVIESPVRQASVYGIVVTAVESLETVALSWRALGLSVGDIKDAIQPGRRIMTIHDLDIGFAVMTPDNATVTRQR